MDVIKQYEDYIGLKKEYIKNPTLENKNLNGVIENGCYKAV
nr:MAG TPA: hypothetical protein [Caudoviricetes sp.]DAZ59197.1 MAG TPA: hypothetical protein [Caudoviricetes sp.]